jgi:hypothetical protein
MAMTTKAITANAVKNNSSTIMNAGTVTGIKNISLGVGTVAPSMKPCVYSATSGNTKVLSGGTFAYDAKPGEIIALGACSKINGSASSALSFTGKAAIRKNINGIIARRSMHITSWNYATGAATKGANTTDSFGTDYAITVSAAVPGNIVYLENGKTPTESSF